MSEARRRSILEAASNDADLVAQLSPVVAAGFGVLPLRRLGDVLTVACFPRTNRQALRLLRDVVELEIVATPFEDAPLHEAIRRAYFPEEETVNFPTFTHAGFLERSENAEVLRREKVEDPGPITCDLPPDQVVLASLTYRSTLRNSDAPDPGRALPDPARTRLDLGDLRLGWVLSDGVPHLYLPEGLDPEARLLLTQFRLSEYRHMHGGGRVSEHHVSCDQLARPPLVIHPTEVQLTGIDAEGGLTFHAYDHPERIGPSDPPARLSVEYHFLSYGNRMQRQIEIELHEIRVFGRDMLEVHRSEAPWGPTELARWFGLPEERERHE